MTVYLERKVVEKNIGMESSTRVSSNPATGAGSIQVGARPKAKMRRANAPSRLLSIGGASLLVTLCLLMVPVVGRGEANSSTYPLEDVHEIAVDASILDVQVKPTDNAELGAYWEASDTWDVQASSEEGVLSLSEDSTIGLHSIRDLDIANKDRTLILEIPSTYKGNISIKTRTGHITISGMDIAGDVSLTTPYGSVEASNLVVQGDLDVSSDTGNLYLEDVSVDGLIRAESKTGALSLTNIQSKDLLDATTRMGSITLRDADAVTMEIATQYGAVRAKGVSVKDDIHIYSYSGDITCQLRDETDAYTVTCSSTHGRTNLPDEQGSGDKRLDIESSMGDITVRFGV